MSVVLTEIVTTDAVMGPVVQWIDKAIQRINASKTY